MTAVTRVGVIGCGKVSPQYLGTLKAFPFLDVAAVADVDAARAAARASEFDIGRACSVDELLADPGIEVVLNLTTPQAHHEVGLRVLEAGKHLYSEKPLCVSYAEGAELVRVAAARGLRLGCAPDTFLGAGQQGCRRLLDAGAIGEPVAGCATILFHGHESWHPGAEFFYQPGGDPVHDFAVYYITALVALLGPVARVTGAVKRTFAERVFTVAGREGDRIEVAVPTHNAGILEFAGGAIVTLVASYDVWAAAEQFSLQLFGSTGSMVLPDPNGFGGAPRTWHDGEWQSHEPGPGYTEQARGIGLADMVLALRQDRPHRAGGALALHVLEVMDAVAASSAAGRHVVMRTACARPEPMAARLEPLPVG